MFNRLAQSSLKALGNVARMGHHQSRRNMAKVVCVLYDDPVGGYPKSYPRDLDHMVSHYPDQFGKPGQTVPTPKGKVLQVSVSRLSWGVWVERLIDLPSVDSFSRPNIRIIIRKITILNNSQISLPAQTMIAKN